MTNINNDLRKDFLKKGYVILKSVFPKEYISELRNKIITLSSKDVNEFEILLDDDIQNILLNERLIESIKKNLSNTKFIILFRQ